MQPPTKKQKALPLPRGSTPKGGGDLEPRNDTEIHFHPNKVPDLSPFISPESNKPLFIINVKEFYIDIKSRVVSCISVVSFSRRMFKFNPCNLINPIGV